MSLVRAEQLIRGIKAHAPANTNTAEMLHTANTEAATSGPRYDAADSRTPRTDVYLDVNSSGLRHSDGTNAEWLARYGVNAMVDTTANA